MLSHQYVVLKKEVEEEKEEDEDEDEDEEEGRDHSILQTPLTESPHSQTVLKYYIAKNYLLQIPYFGRN